MPTLYELTGEYLRLYEMANDCELELDELKDTLESMDGEFQDKAVGYAQVMKEFDGQIETIKAEIDRLNAKAKSLKNSKDRMKEALQGAMEMTGNTKFKTDLFNFNIQNNPPSLDIADDADIPQEYWIAQEPKLDKKKLLAAVKLGEEYKGVTMKQGKSLRIR